MINGSKVPDLFDFAIFPFTLVTVKYERCLQKLKKSSLLIWHLLSKPQIDGEELVNFCGLLRKHELYKKRPMQDFIKRTLDSAAACLKAATWPTRHCSQTANLPRPVFQFAWWSKFDTTVN